MTVSRGREGVTKNAGPAACGWERVYESAEMQRRNWGKVQKRVIARARRKRPRWCL